MAISERKGAKDYARILLLAGAAASLMPLTAEAQHVRGQTTSIQRAAPRAVRPATGVANPNINPRYDDRGYPGRGPAVNNRYRSGGRTDIFIGVNIGAPYYTPLFWNNLFVTYGFSRSFWPVHGPRLIFINNFPQWECGIHGGFHPFYPIFRGEFAQQYRQRDSRRELEAKFDSLSNRISQLEQSQGQTAQAQPQMPTTQPVQPQVQPSTEAAPPHMVEYNLKVCDVRQYDNIITGYLNHVFDVARYKTDGRVNKVARDFSDGVVSVRDENDPNSRILIDYRHLIRDRVTSSEVIVFLDDSMRSFGVDPASYGVRTNFSGYKCQ